jgi:hypothetical protein
LQFSRRGANDKRRAICPEGGVGPYFGTGGCLSILGVCQGPAVALVVSEGVVVGELVEVAEGVKCKLLLRSKKKKRRKKLIGTDGCFARIATIRLALKLR